MYLKHFGLEKSPFSLTPDPRFLFLTHKHREALAALLFGVTERKGLLVMTAEAGTGKTTLLRKVLTSLPSSSVRLSVLVNPTLTRSELLEAILLNFGEKEIPATKPMRLALLRGLLLEADRLGQTAVLIVDEAHLLGAELIEEIRLLSNFETPERKLLQIILVGQQELNSILEQPTMTQVKQRVAIRVRLSPLNSSEIERYLTTRWSRAGSKRSLPFSSDAIQAIARFSGGVPRTVNVICDAALVNAFVTGGENINAHHIWAVAQNLQLSSNPAPSDLVIKFVPRSASLMESSAQDPTHSGTGETETPVSPAEPTTEDGGKLPRVSRWIRFGTRNRSKQDLRIV